MTLTTGAFLRERPHPERTAMRRIRLTRPTVVSNGGIGPDAHDAGEVVEATYEEAVYLIAHGKAHYIEDIEQSENKAVDVKSGQAKRRGK